jgi:hypothetical protein
LPKNEAVVYDLLFKASVEALLTTPPIRSAWAPRSPIVPGGGISLDGTRWVTCRPK